jgi:hypothetical protein
MDNLTYHYQSGTNKLGHVRDVVPAASFMDDVMIIMLKSGVMRIPAIINRYHSRLAGKHV